jgi:DNA modification methylase
MNWRIEIGDCRDVLRTMPAASIHTVVTSPPYFGLRDYGTDGQIGLEPTPDEFVAALVGVFREVRRVLRDDGTVWLNLGDSYASAPPGTKRPGASESSGLHGAQTSERYRLTLDAGTGTKRDTSRIPGVKPKDLLGIPWMVAFALRADGWYLRSDIIWSKPNPMPESVTDRPTKAHEYVFLLSKGPRYFYDADAIREADGGWDHLRSVLDGQPSLEPTNGLMAEHKGLRTTEGRNGAGRNKRSVWTVATQPYAGAHFATFPPKLIEPCILAGAPERACGECGAPWVRVVERTPMVVRPTPKREAWQAEDEHARTQTGGTVLEPPTSRTLGFEPSCSHGDGSARGVVLDPFAGAGTTGLVALQHGREFVGIELSPEYARMARERIETAVRLGFRSPQNGHAPLDGQLDIFGGAMR